jgi:hypothetical protein
LMRPLQLAAERALRTSTHRRKREREHRTRGAPAAATVLYCRRATSSRSPPKPPRRPATRARARRSSRSQTILTAHGLFLFEFL